MTIKLGLSDLPTTLQGNRVFSNGKLRLWDAQVRASCLLRTGLAVVHASLEV
jgi:hypothetical protein